MAASKLCDGVVVLQLRHTEPWLLDLSATVLRTKVELSSLRRGERWLIIRSMVRTNRRFGSPQDFAGDGARPGRPSEGRKTRENLLQSGWN